MGLRPHPCLAQVPGYMMLQFWEIQRGEGREWQCLASPPFPS